MPNANIELFRPRRGLSKYFAISPLQVLNRFVPQLANKLSVFQVTERIVEYPFIHENIPFGGGGKVLDVGSGSTLLPFELASKGYQVWSIDLRRGYRESIRHDNFTFIEGDIRQTNFPDNFFDMVTAISSIEHVGFDGSNVNPEGDKTALQEIRRILKPGGRVIMTVPFGKWGIYSMKGRPVWRVHDLPSLKELLSGFEIEKMQFAILRDGGWRPAESKEVEGIDSLSQPEWHFSKTVAMVVARMPSREGEQEYDPSM